MSPAARLRRIAAALAQGEQPHDADAIWLSDRIAKYLDHAAAGLSLEQALGVAVSPGGEPWWSAEARARRDSALRKLAAEFYPDLRPTQQAREVTKIARRYEASGWRFDRNQDAVPLHRQGKPEEHLFVALKSCDRFPGHRQLFEILSTKHPEECSEIADLTALERCDLTA